MIDLEKLTKYHERRVLRNRERLYALDTFIGPHLPLTPDEEKILRDLV